MESTLNTKQKKFVELMVDDNLYTNEQLAEQCGVDVRTVYRWKRNSTITKEINKLADANLGQYINQANMKLIEVITEGSEHGQLKAIDMLYKSLGKYKEQSEVTINEGKSLDETRALLLAELKA
ncbi:phBC6A51 family helix-turn-helix protein [Priestia megaterium]|uniref:phBC6A51 family helix-turn-helix protein n=1 Tax=Priestia megaterium TaxID=1404 RepID=UPI0023DA765E|nr:phBC6A51 family helix-turn-helix protein [Priestia megaterium]MDF2010215.1 phBC6A51 family helix-turn-helix protein [Priestia megaterium]